jgi:hypothetical protein
MCYLSRKADYLQEIYVMINKFYITAIIVIICLFLTAFSGCIQPSTKATLKEYSNRTDGSRDIRVYQNQDGKVRFTVIKNTDPKDFSIKGLTDEIRHLVVSLSENAFDKPLQPYTLDGHTAVSTSMIWVAEGGATTGVPNEYITVIAYPEHNMIMTFRTNGERSTQEDHMKMVRDFKI